MGDPVKQAGSLIGSSEIQILNTIYLTSSNVVFQLK